MRLLTCARRARRRVIRRFAACCWHVRARPRDPFVGMIRSTWLSVKASEPRSWSRRFPAGKGDEVASAIRSFGAGRGQF